LPRRLRAAVPVAVGTVAPEQEYVGGLPGDVFLSQAGLFPQWAMITSMATDISPDNKRPGFRAWYQRQLFESFAWLTTCLLSGVLIAVILEFVGLGSPGFTPIIVLVVIYVMGLMAIASFRRFWVLLSFAQHCADGATCQECRAYGLFAVSVEAGAIAAICRKCGNRWTIR